MNDTISKKITLTQNELRSLLFGAIEEGTSSGRCSVEMKFKESDYETARRAWTNFMDKAPIEIKLLFGRDD
jgi:hypothetical protein